MKTVGSGKRYVLVGLISLIALLVVSYSIFQAKNIFRGPSITILSPQNGSTVSSPLVTILGKAERISFITLNDRQIFVDEKGSLYEQLLLQNGYNIIQIKATDRFNRRVETKLELIYKKPN